MIKIYSKHINQCKFKCRIAIQFFVFTLLLAGHHATADVRTQADSATELRQAIDKLSSRSGPPGAHRSASEMIPLSLLQSSIWDRLSANFQFARLEHPTIQAQVEFMQQGLYSLTSNLRDASPFLYFIVDEIDRAGLPLDIALLPLVESAFDPLALSNQSAAGLWQFIPATAKDYGLKSNQWYDGRNDVVASTHAAIRYLKRLNQSFDGDWLLALAAYNTGPGNVRIAMQKAKSAGLEPNFWNLKLAKETRDYVPRLIAVNKMITNPHPYGLYLPELKNTKKINTISVGRPISLETAASFANISEKQLRRLNPGYLTGEIPLGGPYHLTIPVEATEQLISQLNKRKLNSAEKTDASTHASAHVNLPPDSSSMSATKNHQGYDFIPYKKYVYKTHTVKRGDNLWDISRTMNTGMDQLMAWNGKTPDTARLHPGEKMIAAFITEENPEDVTGKLINYRVSPNDTLITISDKFGVAISQLKKWNPALWNKNHLRPGQPLKIPVQTSSDL